jgi:hypothetical protein
MKQRPWEANILTESRNSVHFMETENPVPCSQELTTCAYPEPCASRTRPPILLYDPLCYYYIPIHAFVFQVASFLQVSQPKQCMPFSSPPYVPNAPTNRHGEVNRRIFATFSVYAPTIGVFRPQYFRTHFPVKRKDSGYTHSAYRAKNCHNHTREFHPIQSTVC